MTSFSVPVMAQDGSHGSSGHVTNYAIRHCLLSHGRCPRLASSILRSDSSCPEIITEKLRHAHSSTAAARVPASTIIVCTASICLFVNTIFARRRCQISMKLGLFLGLVVLNANISLTLWFLYSLPKPVKPLHVNTVLTVSAKDYIITSCLLRNSRSIKSFINRCLFKFS